MSTFCSHQCVPSLVMLLPGAQLSGSSFLAFSGSAHARRTRTVPVLWALALLVICTSSEGSLLSSQSAATLQSPASQFLARLLSSSPGPQF